MRLDLYFAWRFLRAFGGTLGVFFLIFALIDLIEHIRRFSDDGAGAGGILALVLLNAPSELYQILPLVTIIAAVVLFLGLARSSELVVGRAAGRSAIRALLGPALVAVGLGALALTAVNPLVAAASDEYDSRVARLRGEERALAVSGEGLWLRQGGEGGPAVIRAERAASGGTELAGVTVLRFDEGGEPLERIEAARARLAEGAWRFEEARVWPLGAANPEAEALDVAAFELPSPLTPEEIRDGFGDPGGVAVWGLPAQIARLEAAGFAAERHRVAFWRELAQPAFLLAMVLVAACFTLRPQRGRRTGVMVLGAILTGFGAYVLRDLALVLGEAGQVPPALAVWAPTLAAIGLALGALLHLEEG